MKSVLKIFVMMWILSSCATSTTSQDAFSYGSVKKFTVGKSTAAEVIQTLGKPTLETKQNDYFTLEFNDPKTGYQKVLASFSSKDSKLFSFFWIPGEADPEISLRSAMEKKSPSTFEVENSERDKVHGISNVNFYVDSKLGKSIRFNENSKKVEGIAFFDPSKRMPASKK